MSDLAVAVVFGSVKWLGYCVLMYWFALRVMPAAFLQEQPGRVVARVIGAATCRMLLGLLSGHFLLDRLHLEWDSPALFAALLPVRLAEWAMVTWAFLPALRTRWLDHGVAIVIGTMVSYALDVPAVMVTMLAIPIGIC